MSTGELTFRPMTASEADLGLFKSCFDNNGSPKALDMLRWQFLELAESGLNVDFALDFSTPAAPIVAAVYAVYPVRLRVGEQLVSAVQSIDTMTDSRYRGQGLFVKLAKRVYAACRIEGKAAVFGMPNANSAHGFFTKLGWQVLDPMPFVARPLRTGYILGKLKLGSALASLLDMPLPLPPRPKLRGGAMIREVSQIDEQFAEVWRGYCGLNTCAVERDAAYLRWRLKRPGERYQVLGWYEADKLLGYSIIGQRHIGSNKTGKLMELVYDPQRPDVGSGLIAESLHRLRASGCGMVWGWNFAHAENHAVLKAAGFYTLPNRFWPLQLHMGVCDFTNRLGQLGQREHWYISMLDCDTD